MVYDSVHHTAAGGAYPDTSADSYCCADTYSCTYGGAYPRADAETHTYATAGVNGYTYTYADTYTCAFSNYR